MGHFEGADGINFALCATNTGARSTRLGNGRRLKSTPENGKSAYELLELNTAFDPSPLPPFPAAGRGDKTGKMGELGGKAA
jgi:hypothetical protein